MPLLLCLMIALFLPTSGAEIPTITVYSTPKEAQTDGAITKGWIPDLLPSSSRSIRVTKQISTKESSGEFSFDPADFHSISGHVPMCGGWQVPPISLKAEIAQFWTKGDFTFEIINEDFVWMISCKDKSYCRFWKWLNRE